MRKIISLRLAWGALLVVLLHAPAAQAQSSFFTFVSSAGTDGGGCGGRSTPCATLNVAFANTLSGGVITVIDSGIYGGALTINKSISIVSDGAVAHLGCNATTNAILIDVPAAGVVDLRGLEIDGVGECLGGIRIVRAGAVHLQNCVLRGFQITNAYGISLTPIGAAELYVSNCNLTNNRTGILVTPTGAGTAKVVLNNTQIENNSIGIRAEGATTATLGNSVVSGNSNVGITVRSGASLRLTDSIVTANNTGVSTASGGALLSYGNNVIAGNATNGAPTNTLPLR